MSQKQCYEFLCLPITITFDGDFRICLTLHNIQIVVVYVPVEQLKRVLHQSDDCRIFGRELDGPYPPKSIISIIDHLRECGCNTEGIFRKSPRQRALVECRSEIERGLEPDFEKYDKHVLASVLKDYLRSIPNKILLNSNYELWMKEVVDEADYKKKIVACRRLLNLLPTSHLILLAKLLELLNMIARSLESKMSPSALSVCLAPSFLNPADPQSDPVEGGRKVPLLVEFLLLNAAEVTPPGFSADNKLPILNLDDPPLRKELREDVSRTTFGCPSRTRTAQGEEATKCVHVFREETVGLDGFSLLTVKDAQCHDEVLSPSEGVVSLTLDPPSRRPIVRTIAERLQSLYENNLNVECTSRRLRPRAELVKAGSGGWTCVGMEPLEINWSVRKLKTLFENAENPT